MKASKVLKRYAAGETDFKGISLRGQSFKGQNLSGADFSEADLRGTKFLGVDLRESKFTSAKCGLQKRWATFLLIVSWLLALISGAGSLLVSSFVLLIFDASLLRNQIVGWGQPCCNSLFSDPIYFKRNKNRWNIRNGYSSNSLYRNNISNLN